MKTYEDRLIEMGKVVTDLFDCPTCLKPQRPFAIVEVAPGEWACSDCYLASLPPPEPVVLPPWETEDANSVRAERTRLQNKWRWAVMPDTALNQAAQDRVMLFLKSLNRLTIDYTTPQDVVWPEEPVLTGDDYA